MNAWCFGMDTTVEIFVLMNKDKYVEWNADQTMSTSNIF